MTAKGPNNQMRSRIGVLTLLFVVLGCGAVCVKLFVMQVVQRDFFVQQATQLQTRDTLITPGRGTIYDANMQVLARSATTARVVVNPKGVVSETKVKNGISAEQQQETLAKVLADTLELDYDSVLKKVQQTDSGYVIIASRVEQDTKTALLEALDNAGCIGVDTEPDTRRYYTHGAFLSSVLGYLNGENVGVYGLEAQYESELAGTAGRIVRAQNQQNQDMPYEYDQEIPATDGDSLVLTIDSDIQSYLEKHLETALADNPDARDGVSGIIMDVKTGAILGMANLPDFDPNDAYRIDSERYISELKTNVEELLKEEKVTAVIDDKYYEEGGVDNLPDSIQEDDELVDAIGTLRVNELMKMWRNPTIMDTYEPGSTFKLMNVATAYELGVVNENSSLYCGGMMQVETWPISCWNTSGHGPQTLTESLMNSCNVAMMQIALNTGMERFYDFFRAFGLTDKTGIDLPGEAQGLFHDINKSSEWNIVALATASFGQRFNVTPIQMLNMVCAIVDDGKLKKPYVVQQILNEDGTVRSTTEPEITRQVISADTSAYMRKAMEQVVESGTGKNAYVAGYRVGGKTATSEVLPEYKDGKRVDDQDRYTASFIGVAPMNDPQIAVLVAINDLPESVPHGGGAIAAPVVGRILEDVLPYVGVTPSYSDEESDRREITVPNLIGKDEYECAAALENVDLQYEVVNNGEGTVTDQIPAGGIKIPATGKIILYMGGQKPTEQVVVPNVVGQSLYECKETLEEQRLYLKQKGVATSQITGDTVADKQNPAAGTKVNVGAVITVEFSNMDNVDDR